MKTKTPTKPRKHFARIRSAQSLPSKVTGMLRLPKILPDPNGYLG